MLEVGGDLGEGGEDEAALVQGGVREGEVGGGEDLGDALVAGVEEEIEVDDAGTFGWGVGAVAAHGVLDGEEGVEEVEGGEGGVEEGGGVEEAGLVEVADGVGGVEAGDGGEVAEGGEAVEGLAEVGLGGAEGGGEVGAEGDGGGHGVGPWGYAIPPMTGKLSWVRRTALAARAGSRFLAALGMTDRKARARARAKATATTGVLRFAQDDESMGWVGAGRL